jgi:hypothetical protein
VTARNDRATPAQRALAARIASATRWAHEDGRTGTAKARSAGPGPIAYWEAKVDPTGELAPSERTRRAESAKRAHYSRLALASAKARRRRAS